METEEKQTDNDAALKEIANQHTQKTEEKKEEKRTEDTKLQDIADENKQTKGEKKQSVSKKAKNAVKDEEEEKEEEKQQEQEQEQDKKTQQQLELLKDSITQTTEKVQDLATNLQGRVMSLPTPGGIGLLLLIIFVFLAAIVPVNAAGDTRAKMFWYMLMGRSTLEGAIVPSTGANGASGTFTGGGEPDVSQEVVTVDPFEVSYRD